MDFIYSSKYLYLCQSDSWQYNLQMSVNTPWWGPLCYQQNTDISHVHVNTHIFWNYKYELGTRPTNLTDHKSAYLWSHKSIAMQFVCWVLLWWLSLWVTCPVSVLPPSDLCGGLMWIFMGYFVLVYQLLCCWYILGREISNSLFTNVTNACLSHLTCRHFPQIYLVVIVSSLCAYKHFCNHHYLCSFTKQWTKKKKLKIYSRPKDIVKTSYSNGVIQASYHLHNEDTTLLRLRYLIVAILSTS